MPRATRVPPIKIISGMVKPLSLMNSLLLSSDVQYISVHFNSARLGHWKRSPDCVFDAPKISRSLPSMGSFSQTFFIRRSRPLCRPRMKCIRGAEILIQHSNAERRSDPVRIILPTELDIGQPAVAY